MENLQLAGFGKRLVAYLIDGILLSIVLGIIMSVFFGGIFASMAGSGAFDGTMSEDEAAVTAVAATGGIMLFYFIAVVAIIAYEVLMISSAKQGTIGKIAMKIKVVKEDGSKLSTTDAIIRTIVKSLISGICLIGFLITLFNKKEQSLHDLAGKTLVVNAE